MQHSLFSSSNMIRPRPFVKTRPAVRHGSIAMLRVRLAMATTSLVLVWVVVSVAQVPAPVDSIADPARQAAEVAQQAAVSEAPAPVAADADDPIQGYRETVDFAAPVASVEEYVAQLGADKVLFVVDIDNTLLAMNNNLGSDQWFEWQSYLQVHEPDSKKLVAKTFDELIAVQGLLFTLGKMHPPQDDLPQLIEQAQATGAKTLVLTSRGDLYRHATRRELLANGYDFAKSSILADKVTRGVYPPYDIANLAADGLTEEEAEAYSLSDSPREVSFADGIYMTAGQHKGAMLLALLSKCEQKFEAVVYVDDHGRHVSRVYDALNRRGIATTTYHYKREDTKVKRFQYSDKKSVTRRWMLLDKTLQAVFN